MGRSERARRFRPRFEQLEDRRLLSIGSLSGSAANDDETSTLKGVVVASATDVISLRYDLPALVMEATDSAVDGRTVSEAVMAGTSHSYAVGQPILPLVPVTIAVPYGYAVGSIGVAAGTCVGLPGTYLVEEYSEPVAIGAPSNAAPSAGDAGDMMAPGTTVPESVFDVVGVQRERGVDLLRVNLNPVRYAVDSGQISYYTALTLNVSLVHAESKPQTAEPRYRSNDLRPLEDEVANPDALSTYAESTGDVTRGICSSADSYQYVVITSQAFANATTDYTLNDLVAAKQARGMSATIVNLESIYANYTGVDQPEQIRNFILDAYNNWETDYVLLGGDTNVVPYRSLWVNLGMTAAEQSIPSDLYYQCLDGNYNYDGDAYWGETTDGPSGADVDLSAEVYIGRASAASTAEMANFVYKTLAYEQAASSDYRRQAMMVGEYLGFGGVSDYATASMEEIRLGSTSAGYTTAGFAADATFATATLYDSSTYTWSASNLVSLFNSGTYGIYNHLGHANTSYVMKLSNSTVDTLTNDDYFFIYSQGCYPGDFPNDAIAEHFTTSTRTGAAAVVFNSRYGWGMGNSTDGPSQRPNREFWDALFGERINQLGVMNADSHQDILWDIADPYTRWVTYETTLFGDPAALVVSLDLTVSGSSPAGGSTVSTAPTDFAVTFGEAYLPSSVDVGDLWVNGVAASSFTFTSPYTVTFYYNTSPVTAQGTQTMSLAAGSVLRLSDSTGNRAWNASFRYDTVTTAVSSTEPADGSTVTLPLGTLRVNLNEAIASASVGADDITLSQGTVTAATLVDSDTIDYTVSGITQEATLTMQIAAGALTDVYGNPAAAYSGSFVLDYGTVPYTTPLDAVEPLGSLVYDPFVTGAINSAGDVDTFTIELDAGQTVTAVVTADSTLWPTIALSGPGGASAGPVAASRSGQGAVLQTVAVSSAGTYSFVVGGQSGSTGGYSFQLILNAAVEHESFDDTTNDDQANAQDLTAAFVSLGGAASRAAVLGTMPSPEGELVASEGFESGTLGSSWTTRSSDSGGRIQLTGSNGTADGSYALVMDRTPDGTYTRNEATWTVNLAGLTQATLVFSHAVWNDEDEAFSAAFTDYYNADGVAISADGTTWYPVWNAGAQTAGVWTEYSIDLDVAAAAAGISLGSAFRIRFQQYDNYGLPSDGRGYDQIRIATPQGPYDWYRFNLNAGESATLALACDDAQAALGLYYGSQLVAHGVAGENLAQLIDDFVATASGTYSVCVGGTSADYNLTAVRNAAFDAGGNSLFATAQDITGTRGVLGHYQGGWTFLVYMTADNNLEQAGIDDFLEMSSIGSTAQVNIVVQLDRAASYDTRYDDWTGTRRGLVEQGDVPDAGWGTALGELNMGSSDSLQDFASWARNAYPAEHYALVLWDHGGGFNGVCFDDADGDDLSMADLATAFDAVPELSLIGFDACLMGMAEIAYQLRHEAQVLVASEETIPWDGYEYQDFLNYLVANPAMDARTLASRMLDAYQLRYDSSGDCTLSAVDLAQLGSATTGLAGALERFASTMLGTATAADWTAVQAARTAAQAWSYSTFRDLGDFMQRVSAASVSPTIATAADDVLAVLEDAVIRAYDGPSVYSSGLSIYVPGVGESIGSLYTSANLQFVADTRWEDFLAQMLINHVGSTQWTNVEESARYWETSRRSQRLESEEGAEIAATEAPSSAADPGDWYRVNVVAGNSLTFTTAIPGAGSGEFVNTFNPCIELYDSAGLLLAADDDSLDGRNARLQFTALADGWYWIRVASSPLEPGTKGEYFLGVDGATGTRPSFAAMVTDLDEGRFSVTPTTIAVDFNDLVLLTSVAAADLRIDGQPSLAVASVVDGDTLIFQMPAGLAEGWHTVTIAAGAIDDLQGTPIDAFSSQFYLDFTAPRVIASTILAGDVVPLGSLLYTLSFSEPLLEAGLDFSDVFLVGERTGTYAPTALYYDRASVTLTLRFMGLADDYYTLTLYSGDGQLEDVAGNDLDGDPSFPLPSGDGTSGGNFTVVFSADQDTLAFPESLEMLEPAGALVYSGSAEALLYSNADSDRFTLPLNAGQRLTTIVDPATSFAATLALYGPGGGLVGSTTASAGQDAMLQSLLASASGTYTLAVGSAGGTPGMFTVRVLLNAGLELEGQGASNGTAATAEELDATFIDLGPAQRGAVVGTSALAADIDFYSFSLAAGETVTLAIQGDTAGLVQLDVTDVSEAVLASAVSATSPEAVIHNFSAAEGTYYARITGVAATDYRLVVTRNADFDTEPNDDLATAQELGPSGTVLGHPGASGVLFAADAANDAIYAVDPATGASLLVGNAGYNVSYSGLAYGGETLYISDFYGTAWSLGRIDVATGAGTIIGPQNDTDIHSLAYKDGVLYGFSYSAGLGTMNTSTGAFTAIANSLPVWMIGADCDESAGTVYAIGGDDVLYTVNVSAGTATAIGDTGVSFGYHVGLAWSAGDGQLYAVGDDSGSDNLYRIDKASGAATLVGATALATADALEYIPGISFESIAARASLDSGGNVALAAGSGGDYYRFTVAAGEPIYLVTSTPGGGALPNNFDPLIELYAPSGTLLAADDNGAADGRNAELLTTAPVAGTYTVRVVAAGNDAGEYVLTRAGAPIVITGVSTDVAEGGPGDTCQVVLGIAPTGTVTVQLAGGSQVLAFDSANPANTFLTFTPDNWMTPQTVGLTAVDDALLEGNARAEIALTLVSADARYTWQGATLAINVFDNDDTAPQAADDTYQVAANGLLEVDTTRGVLINDIDADIHAMSAVTTPVEGPFHALSFELRADGSFTYVPVAGFSGTDWFTYNAFDGWCASSVPATVTIHIEGPQLLKDINPLPAGSYPQNLIEVGGIAFFIATDREHGTELWRSDGTREGTVLVKDIYPGSGSSNPGQLVNFNGELFFRASTSANGTELWRSDGSADGTSMVADLYSGSYSSNPTSPTPVGRTLYFAATNSANGTELWRTDGTASGTKLVADICSGSASSSPANLRNLNGLLLFTATNGVNGTELWSSDGSAAGTQMLLDIQSGSTSSAPASLTVAGSTLFFTANDGTSGGELWRSDGTSSGTALVKDIRPDVNSSGPAGLVNMGGLVFFTANDGTTGTELWRSDGSELGTGLVKDIRSAAASSSPSNLTVVGSVLFFSANNGVNGVELWRSDGSDANTLMVADIVSGGSGSSPTNLCAVGGTLYFSAAGPTGGRELWRSDGAEAGTFLAHDIRPGSDSSSPGWLTNVHGTLMFSASDANNNLELWRSDDSGAGTSLVSDIYRGGNGSSPGSLTAVGDKVFLTASDGIVGSELWQSNGTVNGTALVKDIYSGGGGWSSSTLTNVNGILYFASYESTHGWELWRSDGTADGTTLVKDIWTGPNSSSPYGLCNANGTLYFWANDGVSGTELWRSDGTAAGTGMVKDLTAGSTGTSPRSMTGAPFYLYSSGPLVFFSLADSTTGYELWRSDGTADGTFMVKDIYAGTGSSYVNFLTNVNGVLYFQATDGANGYELWRSDGTAGGTYMVKDIYANSGSSSPSYLTGVGGTLYFRAYDSASGYELWRSDGTADGTYIVKDIAAGGTSSYPYLLVNVNGTLFFQAGTGDTSYELWKSDGTAAGTVLVKDIQPGPAPSYPSSIINVHGRACFLANDGLHGNELWVSDGTAAGTTLLADIYTGPSDLTAAYLTAAGPRLFFTADDGRAGRELWSVVVNRVPQCHDDTYTMDQEGTLVVSAPYGTAANDDDPDGDALQLQLIASPAHGQFQFNSDGSFSYVPEAGFVGADGFTYRAFDGLEYSAATSVSIMVTAVNHAPVLDNSGTMALPTICEDDAACSGLLVADLIANAGGDRITDPDVGALEGIAVTIADNSQGTWQYKVGADGVWTDFGSPSDAEARLLASDTATWLRFVPAANWNGTLTAGLGFRAWDRSMGTAGATVDATAVGGQTAFSDAVETVAIAVTPVNDAPTGADVARTMLEDAGYVFALADFACCDAADSPAHSLAAIGIASLPGEGTLTLNGAPLAVGQSVAVTDIELGRLVFTPAANAAGAPYAAFSFQVQDDGGTASGGTDLDPTPRTATLNVTPQNDPPVVGALAGSSEWVEFGQDLTLIAAGVSDPLDPTGAVVSVEFYRETNGVPGLQTGSDTLVGADDDSSDGWSVTVSTVGLAPGDYTYYAQATDGEGGRSPDGTAAPATLNSIRMVYDLDVDGNGSADALTDGILILRYLFDPAGQWNFNDALGTGAQRTTRTELKSFLDGGRISVLDADGNGAPDALTDGILILRYLFDPTGAWNYSDALGSGATRTTRVQIKAFLDQFNPSSATSDKLAEGLVTRVATSDGVVVAPVAVPTSGSDSPVYPVAQLREAGNDLNPAVVDQLARSALPAEADALTEPEITLADLFQSAAMATDWLMRNGW